MFKGPEADNSSSVKRFRAIPLIGGEGAQESEREGNCQDLCSCSVKHMRETGFQKCIAAHAVSRLTEVKHWS